MRDSGPYGHVVTSMEVKRVARQETNCMYYFKCDFILSFKNS